MKNSKFILMLFIIIAAVGAAEAFVGNKDVPRLKEDLKYGDRRIKMDALKKINRSGLSIEELHELLDPMLEEDVLQLRLLGIRILFEHGDKTIVRTLYSYLKEDTFTLNEKLRILRMLELLGNQKLISGLTELIDSEPDDRMRLAYIETHSAFFPLTSNAEKRAQILKQILISGTSSNKRKALRILKKFDEIAVPLIVDALEDENIAVSDDAFRILVSLGSAEVQSIFKQYASSSNPELRYSAHFGLGLLGQPQYFKYFDDELQNKDEQRRKNALDFLYRKIDIDTTQRFLPTIENMAANDPNEAIQIKAQQYVKWSTTLHAYQANDRQP